jgi:hypothetical protein
MAGSGPNASIGGWVSGPDWYDRHRERRDKFLSEHPEWNIAFVRSMDRYEASSGETDTELVILQDKALGSLMDRLEARYANETRETPSEDLP